MSSSAYWQSRIDYLKANQPPKMENYYNQSFVDKMNEAQKNIDNLVAEKDKSWAATGQKQDEYKAFQGTMSEYKDVYTNSKSEFGVDEHQDVYEKSKKALALAESTLEALPSSINAGSNRVLTQQQRENRYNALANRAMNYRDNLMARTSAYEEVWKQARQNQADYAKAEIASQWGKLDDYNDAWLASLDAYTQAEERLTKARDELRSWQNQYRRWQFNQWDNANTIWLKQFENALERRSQAAETEIAVAYNNARMNIANRNAAKTWDFGGGYTMKGVSGKNALYYYNGQTISAGRFLEATGANGAQWDKWNDVWNSGVRTSGVGSDTVEAFNRRSAAGNQYAYLFR